MAVAADIGSLGGWGTAVEKAGEAARVGARTNPVGAVLIGILTPSTLGDSTITGALNSALETVEEQIQREKGNISDYQKALALQNIKDERDKLNRTCNPNNSNCNKQKHNGRIQAQNGAKTNQMIVTATEANSAWVDLPAPPSLTLCKLYAKSVRVQMIGLKGHSPDKKKGQKVDYEKGATTAYNNLVSWMTKNTPGRVGVSKWSFSFDGTHKQDRVMGDSRRIDIDIRTGLILKSA